MKKGNGDLTRAERLEIGIVLGKGYSQRSIARALKRSPNTVSYEIRNNSVHGIYDPIKADQKARTRKHYRRFQWAKIEENSELKAHIISKLRIHWNPDEIAGDMRRRKLPFYASKTAIYEWLRTARGERYCVYLYSKRKRVKKRKQKAKKVIIPNRVDISMRFKGAANRTRYRHYERDTMVGRHGTRGGIAVGYEMKAKLVLAEMVKSMRPREHSNVDRKMFAPVEVLSTTRDNGIENQCHEQLPFPSFFCQSYSSWQKGGVENANKMLRRYFPKNTDFSKVSKRSIAKAVSLINNKPRRSLGYRSALEVARNAGIIKNESVLIEG